jgi:hypothetical protein
MQQEVKLFFFILSIVYTLRFVIEFVFKLFDDNPSVLVISKVNQVFLYFSFSYIITYFLIPH